VGTMMSDHDLKERAMIIAGLRIAAMLASIEGSGFCRWSRWRLKKEGYDRMDGIVGKLT
jgi:hypothetical protein